MGKKLSEKGFDDSVESFKVCEASYAARCAI